MTSLEPLRIRLLGETEVARGTRRLPLPPSKKTRALLGYLVLTQRPQRRERLCDLLWDVADDPRAALRWSLSKLRELVDSEGARRLVADREHVSLELGEAEVDVFEARKLAQGPLAELSIDELERTLALFRGELLEGLTLPDFHAYHAFCMSEREALRTLEVRLVRELLARDVPGLRALALSRKWVELEPGSEQARERFARLLKESGRERELLEEVRTSERLQADVPAARAPVEIGETSAPRKSELPQPFVGRATELDMLARFVRPRQRAALLLLSGEPGIGKSQLLDQLLQRERMRGTHVERIVAYEVDPGFPLAPFRELLERTSVTIAPESGANGERARELLAQAARAVCERLIPSTAAALWVVEDVQWLDEPSALLLQQIVRAAREVPLAIVLSTRSGELLDNAHVRRVVRAFRAEGLLREHVLGPLHEQETRTLVSYVASGVDARLIHEESAGNPLFAIELARAPGREGVPSTITRLVRERMESLAPELIDVLRWSAVLGPDVRLVQLEALLDVAAEQFVEQLEQLEQLGWLSFDGSRSVRFSHELVRRSVYDGLSSPRRRLMHARVARLLAGQPDSDGRAAELAHHAVAGGDARMAVEACLVAGRRCLELFSPSDALSLARRGLSQVDKLEPTERCRREIELHELALHAHKPEQPDALGARFLELAHLALSLSALDHARRAFFMHSFLRWERGQIADAQRFSREAERCSREGSPAERLRGLSDAARCLALLERDAPDGEAFVLEAEALVAAGQAELATVPLSRGLLALARGELELAQQALDRAVSLARGERDRLEEYLAHESRFELLLMRGEVSQAELVAHQLLTVGGRSGEGSEAPFARAALALARCLQGQDESERLAEAVAELQRADAKQRGAYVLVRWAEYALARSELGAAEQRAQEALRLAEAVERTTEVVLARVVLAQVALERGDRALCERHREALQAWCTEDGGRTLTYRARTARDALLTRLERGVRRMRHGGA